MLKQITKLILITSIYILSNQHVEAACEHGYFGNGDGTTMSPYEVRNGSDFVHISKHEESNYNQIQDIEVIDNWALKINGIYDGQNHKIDVSKFKYYKQLFGTISETGVIQNVIVVGTGSKAQGVVWNNRGTIRNVIIETNAMVLNSSNYNGVVSTNNYGVIEDCINRGAVNERSYSFNAGGIVARNYGTIRRCINEGKIFGARANFDDRKSIVGGIAGYNTGVIEDCYNTSNDLSTLDGEYSPTNVGGIVGLNTETGIIKNCYHVGEMYHNTSGAIVGGIDPGRVGNLINNYYLASPKNTHGYNTAVWNGSSYNIKIPIEEAPGTIKYTDAQMRSQTLVNLLNSGRNIWKLGNFTYPYPLYRKYVAVEIYPSNSNIGDNTPISLNLSYQGSIDEFNNIRVLVNGVVKQTFTGSLNSLSVLVSDQGNIKVQVVLMDNDTSVFSSDTVTLNKRNLLETTLTATQSSQPNSFLILDDADRYYENNTANQSLVREIQNKSVGIFLIYNDVSDVLIPLLKS